MNNVGLNEQIEHAERAVAIADEDVRNALQVLGEGAPSRLGQIGIAAIAVGLAAALIVRRGRRSGSRLAKAIDYSVLLPLAASVIPRVVSALSSPRPVAAPRAGDYAAPPR